MENTNTFRYTLANVTAIVSFIIGWTLTIINFFISPIGEVSDSTLWILGQALVYVGSVVGITSYVTKEMDIIKKTLK